MSLANASVCNPVPANIVVLTYIRVVEMRHCLAPMPSITLRFIAATALESFISARMNPRKGGKALELFTCPFAASVFVSNLFGLFDRQRREPRLPVGLAGKRNRHDYLHFCR